MKKITRWIPFLILTLGAASARATVVQAPLTGAAPGLPAIFGPMDQPQLQAWQSVLSPFFEFTHGPTGLEDAIISSKLLPRAITAAEDDYPRLIEATARAFMAAGHGNPETIRSHSADTAFLIEAIHDGLDAQARALRSADPAALAEAAPILERLMPVYERHFPNSHARPLQEAYSEAKGQKIEGAVRRTEAELAGNPKSDQMPAGAAAAAEAADSPHLTLLKDLVQELKDSSDSDDDERTIARIKKLVGKRQEERLQFTAVKGLSEYLENADDEDRKNEAMELIMAIAGESVYPSVQKAAVAGVIALAGDENFSYHDETADALENLAKDSPYLDVKQAAQAALTKASSEAGDDDVSTKLFDVSLAVLASYPEQAASAQAAPPAPHAAQAPQQPLESPHLVMTRALLETLKGSDDTDASKKSVTRLETLAKGRLEPGLLTAVVEGLVTDLFHHNDDDYDLHVMQALGSIAKKMAYYPIHNLMLQGFADYIEKNAGFSSVGDMVGIIEKIAKAGTLAVKQRSLAALGAIYQHASDNDNKDSAFDAFERVLASDKGLTPAVTPLPAQPEETPAPFAEGENPYLGIARSMVEALQATDDPDAGKRIVDRLQVLARSRAEEPIHSLIVAGILSDIIKANNVDYEDYAIGRLEEIVGASPFASVRRAVVTGLVGYLSESRNQDPNVTYTTEVLGRLATTPGLKRLAIQDLLNLVSEFESEDQSKILAAAQSLLDSDPSLSPRPQAPAAPAEPASSQEGQPALRPLIAETVIGLLAGEKNPDSAKKLVDRLQALAQGADEALQRQILNGLAERLAQSQDSDDAAYALRAMESVAASIQARSEAVSAVVRFVTENPGFKYVSYAAEVVERLALGADEAVQRQAVQGLLAAWEKSNDPAYLDAAHKITGSSPALAQQGELPKLPKPKTAPPFKEPGQLIAAMAASLAAAGAAYGLLALGLPWAVALGALAGLTWVAVTGIAARHSLTALAHTAVLGAYAALPLILKTGLAADQYMTWAAVGGWLFLAWAATQSLKYGRLRLGLAASLVTSLAIQTALHWDRISPALRNLGLPL